MNLRDIAKRFIWFFRFAILAIVVSGCGSMVTQAHRRADILFLQPPHNRLIVDDETIRITFEDATKVIGQPCTCAAAGFSIARAGLAALDSDGRPVRGELYLFASKDHAVTDVLAYILEADRRADPTRGSFFLDPSLSDDSGTWRYILADPANRRAVEVSYYKSRLMTASVVAQLRPIEEKAESGTVTPEEKNLFKNEMKRMVNILLDPAEAKTYIEIRPWPYDELERRYPILEATNGR